MSVFLPLEHARLAAAAQGAARTALFARYSVIGALCASLGALAAAATNHNVGSRQAGVSRRPRHQWSRCRHTDDIAPRQPCSFFISRSNVHVIKELERHAAPHLIAA